MAGRGTSERAYHVDLDQVDLMVGSCRIVVRVASRIRFAVILPLAWLMADVRSARADIKAECVEANARAQDLRRDGKLLSAREQLLRCADPTCPTIVRDDCARRMDDVDKTLPTIVFEVKDPSGADVSAVSVTLDGKPWADSLQGKARPADPGSHVFVFTVAGLPPVQRSFVLTEGEKGRRERIVLESAPRGPSPATTTSPPPAPPPATTVSPPPSPPESNAESPSAPSTGGAAVNAGSPSALGTIGWVTIAIGGAGLAVGAISGIVALNDKNGAHCGSDNLCDPGTSSGIKSAALISDIGLIAGGALLAGGVAMVVLAPKVGSDTRTSLALSPVVVERGGGAVLGGTW
jgi:hypothetical protein